MEMRTRPVTEEEAEELLCPFTFHLDGRATVCKASACMLWRWKNYGTTGDRVEPTGYCGAGGDPS